LRSAVIAATDCPALELQKLLLEVGYDGYSLRIPGVSFSVVSGPGAPRSWRRALDDDFYWGSYACLIEGAGYRYDP